MTTGQLPPPLPAPTVRARRGRSRSGGQPRIEDVAALAGIAAITVSRVLRQPDKVAAETRARVLAAVEQLGYIPNFAASSLASRRSGIIAIVVPTIANSVFADTVRGLSEAVATAGFQVLLGETGYRVETERRLVQALIGRQPEALALVGVASDPDIRALLVRARLPIAETWDLADEPVDCLVGFSNHEAGRAIGGHLIDRGYRRLAFVGSDDPRARQRLSGFRAAIAAAGLTPPAQIMTETRVTFATGRKALDQVVAGHPEVDAVFFATDVLAVGALLECRRRGIDVPGRLAIAGLGDLEISGEVVPALTTVRVPAVEMGAQAAALLINRIAGKPDPRRVIDLGFRVIARDST